MYINDIHLPPPLSILVRIRAFTLIELSIALVIIGLIVGGVLVGKDLIDTARTRSQLSQIEQYNVAANTFKLKYNCLPGDCRNATQFGFKARGTNRGQGDGNAAIESYNGQTATSDGCPYGEVAMFWVDLTAAKLIAETFTYGTSTTTGYVPHTFGQFGYLYPDATPSAPVTIGDYYPLGKIPKTYVMVSTDGYWINAWNNFSADGLNYFAVTTIDYLGGCGAASVGNHGFTPSQTFYIDNKVDDGFPQSGRVVAKHPYTGYLWNGAYTPMLGENVQGSGGTPTTAATGGSTTTCYDNNATNGTSQQYSIRTNNANRTCSMLMRAGF